MSTLCPHPFLSPPQEQSQSGLQQHCHPGGSEETGLFTKPGETALKEQHHSPTELSAAADSGHERVGEAEASTQELSHPYTTVWDTV